MRVLVYTTLFPNNLQPNAGVFIKQRMVHFAKLSGNAVRVIAPVPYCPSWFPLKPWNSYAMVKKSETSEGISVFHPRYPIVPKVSMLIHGLSLFLSSLRTVKSIQRNFSFDLIDGHYIYPDGFAAVLLGKVLRKPVLLSARGSDINQFSEFVSIRPMIKWALREADGIISVCNALKKDMVNLGINPNKISVIPNGVDLERFVLLKREECRRSLSIPETEKMILSVGSLIPRKGFDLLIKAIAPIVSQQPEICLRIVGDGPQRLELDRLVEGLGLQDHVTFVGERLNEELCRWYNSADVFCLASSREGWANVIMEALACGCPVVATNVYGAPEILTSTSVGCLVERTPEAIRSAISQAFFTGWDRKRIRDHVASRNWTVVAREVEEVFNRCLE